MSSTALLLIDFLQDFFREEPLKSRRSLLVQATNALLGIARSRQIRIVWIRQEFAPDLSDAFLEIGERASP